MVSVQVHSSPTVKMIRPPSPLGAFDGAIGLDDAKPVVWNNKGRALWNMGRMEEALICFEKAIKLHENYEEAWLNRGNVLIKLNREEEAVRAFEKVAAINPRADVDNEKIWLDRGEHLEKEGR